MASLPGIRIISEIFLFTATLTDKDVGMCSISKSYNQNANIINEEYTIFASEMHVRLCGSIKALVVRCRHGLVNTLGLYVNTLEYTELLNGSFLIRYMEVRYSLLYYVLLILAIEGRRINYLAV